MSKLNLHTKEGDLELTFTFYANRQYERKVPNHTTPEFVREILSSRVRMDHLLAMLECCLIKHHPKLRGGKLEKVLEFWMDKRDGNMAHVCKPILEAIVESKMFAVDSKDDDEDGDDSADYQPVTDEERADVMGEPIDEVGAPDAEDPSS